MKENLVCLLGIYFALNIFVAGLSLLNGMMDSKDCKEPYRRAAYVFPGYFAGCYLAGYPDDK